MTAAWRERGYWALLGAVLLIWLNQGVPVADWQRSKDRVFVSHDASIAETARYPALFLYRRAADEELYFALASAMLGEETNHVLLAKAREGSPPAFSLPPPPADGAWHPPYVEVPIEYPPLMIPFMLLPRLLTSSLKLYCWIFGGLMGLCLFAATMIMVRTRRLDTKPAVLWTCAALLLHGAMAIQRLDAVPALLLALAASSWIRAKREQAAVWIGLAGAVKFLPILFVLPMLAIDPECLPAVLRPETRRAALARSIRFVAIAGVTFVVGLLPFFAFSSHALSDVLAYHGLRGLHGESFVGAFWAALSLIGGNAHPAEHSFGSFNLVGAVPALLARGLMPALVLSLTAITARLVRRRDYTIELTFVLCLALLWALGKVFSPQYLTWAIPFVPFLVERRAWVALGSLLGLFGISQLYFRGYFDSVYLLEPLGVVTLVVRNAFLIVLLLVLSKQAKATQSEPMTL